MISAASRAKLFSRSRVIPLLLVLLTGGTLLTADVSSSEAAGQRAAASCTLNVPARWSIATPYAKPPFTLGADCAAAGVIDARWEAKHPDGTVMKKAYFNFNYPSSWGVFDTTRLAPWTWQPAGARTRGDVTLATDDQQTPSAADTSGQIQASVPQNTPTTDIRMRSKVDVVPTPPEDCVGEVWAQRWAYTPHAFVNYGGRTGSIQLLNTSTGGWYVIVSFTTDGNGRWRGPIPHTWDGTFQYRRVVIYDGQYIFGSISPTYSGTVYDCGGIPAPSVTTSKLGSLGVIDPKIEVSKDDPGPLEPPSGR